MFSHLDWKNHTEWRPGCVRHPHFTLLFLQQDSEGALQRTREGEGQEEEGGGGRTQGGGEVSEGGSRQDLHPLKP